MGKKHRKSRITKELKPEDERRKIRESILNVFRARIQSPSGGGALLVGSSSREKHRTANQRAVHEKVSGSQYVSPSTSGDSDSSRSSVMSLQHKKRKPQYRKKKKGSSTKARKSITEDTGELKHHLRQIKTVSQAQQLKASHIIDNTYNMITQQRLTRQIGLFNKGKKSDKISRAISISESVKKKTNEDLQHIIIASDNIDDVQGLKDQRDDISCMEIVQSDEPGNLTTDSKETAQLMKTPHDVSGSSVLSMPSCASTYSSVSSSAAVTGVSKMPKSPPLSKIGEFMLKDAFPRQMFMGRSLLGETVEDLKRLMRQNAPRPTTPTDKKLGSENRSHSARRSLFEHQSETHAAPPKTVQLNKENYPHAGLCGVTSAFSSMLSHGDARTLLVHNDAAISTRIHHVQPPCAASLLYDEQSIRRHHSPNGMKLSTIDSYAIEQLRRDNSYRNSQSSYHSEQHDYDVYHSRPTATVTSAAIGDYPTQQVDCQNAVLTQYNEHPEYMPTFHGDYYNDILRVDDSVWPHCRMSAASSQGNTEAESMDILEYLDTGTNRAEIIPPEPSHLYMAHVRPTSPDSDGSPMWLPQPPMLPTKPSLSTPSPEKIYPRRLY